MVSFPSRKASFCKYLAKILRKKSKKNWQTIMGQDPNNKVKDVNLTTYMNEIDEIQRWVT
ncbi:hypothetical protein Hanom_Chr05g00454161 [Helianthus anomalus]